MSIYNYSNKITRMPEEGESTRGCELDEDGDIVVKKVTINCSIAKSAFLLDAKYNAARQPQTQGAAGAAARQAIRGVVEKMDMTNCILLIQELTDATQLGRRGLGGDQFEAIHKMFQIDANRVILVDLARKLGFANPADAAQTLVPKTPEHLITVLKTTVAPEISQSIFVGSIRETAQEPVRQRAVVVKKSAKAGSQPPSPTASTASGSGSPSSAPSTPTSTSSNSSRSSN